GQRLLLSDDPTMAAISGEVPPNLQPWTDFPVTDGRPLSRKTNAQRYGPQHAAIARALNEPSTDPAEMRVFTDASWNPHTHIAIIVGDSPHGYNSTPTQTFKDFLFSTLKQVVLRDDAADSIQSATTLKCEMFVSNSFSNKAENVGNIMKTFKCVNLRFHGSRSYVHIGHTVFK
ncbi:hypothetical protein HPB47_003847, partial [Ixodes persulcatus]